MSFYNFLGKFNECKDETKELFKTKYAEFVFAVEGELVGNGKEGIIEKEDSKLITVKNTELTKNILNAFGELIQNFGIDFENIPADKSTEIVRHFNSTKLDSLLQLSLENGQGNNLDEWTKELPNVSGFRFSSHSKKELTYKQDQKKLNVLLPNLERLFLDNTRALDWLHFIGDKHTELSILRVELPMIKNKLLETYVHELLKNSKKLEYFTVSNAYLKLLQDANQNAIELKNLTLHSLASNYDDDEIESVDFKNVRFFEIDIKNKAIPKKLRFSSLEGITLNVPEFTKGWIEFIANNISSDSVEFFALTSTKKLSNEDVLKIPEHLPKLTNVAILSPSTFLASDIEAFVKSINKLQKLLLSAQMDEGEFQSLQNSKIEHFDVEVIKFGKKSVNIVVTR